MVERCWCPAKDQFVLLQDPELNERGSSAPCPSYSHSRTNKKERLQGALLALSPSLDSRSITLGASFISRFLDFGNQLRPTLRMHALAALLDIGTSFSNHDRRRRAKLTRSVVHSVRVRTSSILSPSFSYFKEWSCLRLTDNGDVCRKEVKSCSDRPGTQL